MKFDYIIIGAGSAGCVLANRLTENGKYNVAIFEAGKSSDIWKVKMPLALLYTMQDPKYKQMETMNQGMEVSEPYLEANKQAFSKNNPMNAISQETPVGDRVDAFLKYLGS